MKSIIQLTALALVAAATGVRAIDLPFTLRGSSSADEDEAPMPGLREVGEVDEGMCGSQCTKKSDCWKGGVVECGDCDLDYVGTRFYGQCIDDSCGRSCESNRDCTPSSGGHTYCPKCDLKYAGTRTYKTCVPASSPSPPPPSPTPYNPFPKAGSCKKSCRHDKDCQVGGYNPCGKCGSQKGTKTHHRCYMPKTAEE